MTTTPKTPGFNDNESPILRLFMRKDARGRAFLSLTQFQAAEALRRDFERARLSPRVVASYREGVSGGSKHWQMSDNHLANMTDATIAARQRTQAAFDAVGPELGSILYYVCCLAGGLEEAERRMSMPMRSGKAVLALALTRLARHYGLEKSDGRERTPQFWAAKEIMPNQSPHDAPHPA
jgi:Domain of unknown function (DUF6456)